MWNFFQRTQNIFNTGGLEEMVFLKVHADIDDNRRKFSLKD